MTDREKEMRRDRLPASEEAASSFDSFEIDCPKCGSQIHVPYGRMPCSVCGQPVFYDPMTNRAL